MHLQLDLIACVLLLEILHVYVKLLIAYVPDTYIYTFILQDIQKRN